MPFFSFFDPSFFVGDQLKILKYISLVAVGDNYLNCQRSSFIDPGVQINLSMMLSYFSV